jgi:hypothetical protein
MRSRIIRQTLKNWIVNSYNIHCSYILLPIYTTLLHKYHIASSIANHRQEMMYANLISSFAWLMDFSISHIHSTSPRWWHRVSLAYGSQVSRTRRRQRVTTGVHAWQLNLVALAQRRRGRRSTRGRRQNGF